MKQIREAAFRMYRSEICAQQVESQRRVAQQRQRSTYPCQVIGPCCSSIVQDPFQRSCSCLEEDPNSEGKDDKNEECYYEIGVRPEAREEVRVDGRNERGLDKVEQVRSGRLG